MANLSLDRTDRRILRELQRDARLSTTALAERIALTPTPCWRRVKALESVGAIVGYRAIIDPHQLGYGVTAFISILLDSHSRELGAAFERGVREIPEVISCHNISGHFDFLLQVVGRDMASFGEFVRDHIRCLPGVKEMNCSFSLKEVKADREVPIPD